MKTFTLITTCKGRLHHLQQTLPLMVKQPDSECIVVDYSCPQKTGDWVELNYPQVKVVRVTDDDGWQVSRARNLGAAAAQTEWLVFIDADILLTGDLLPNLRPQLAPGSYFRSGSNDYNHYGSFVCCRSDFDMVGGYDEILVGWGREDKDIYYRLDQAGCEQKTFQGNIFSAIQHGDEERTRFSPYKNRLVSQIISTLYLQMKYDLEKLQPEQPSLEMHRKLYNHARHVVLNGLSHSPNTDMTARLLLGKIRGAVEANPLYEIERSLIYHARPHPQRTVV